MSDTRRKRRSGAKLDQEVLERLMAGDIAPIALAEAMGLNISELIEWSVRPDIARLLHGAIRLSDLHVQMLLCKFRTNAALHLINIASQGEPSELSRKACVDLLRTELKGITQERSDLDPLPASPQPSAPTEASILAALEQIGEHA